MRLLRQRDLPVRALAYAPLMAGSGAGAIITVSTVVGSRGVAGMAAYGASKAALELLTQVAQTVVYLAGERSGYITGVIIPVAGGRTSAL